MNLFRRLGVATENVVNKLKELEIKCQFVGANFERKKQRALTKASTTDVSLADAIEEEIRSLSERDR